MGLTWHAVGRLTEFRRPGSGRVSLGFPKAACRRLPGMLSLSFVSCYFVVKKKSREMAHLAGRRRNRKRRHGQLLLDCALRVLVIGALTVFAVGLAKSPAFLAGQIWEKSKESSPSRLARASSMIGFGIKEARLEITTKDLYDEIKFENQQGGAWTQGWDVQYKGNEWEHEKLKVFVVPHSHNDPGWLYTMEEYYQQRTRKILSTIVHSLAKDDRRKFIWEEVSYLKRWWDDAWQSEKDDFLRLVKNGQLEIVGGGWVMNDEANSHYYAIIEQMVAGNLWLLDNIGVTPCNAWAIDPFGHSSTMAYLLKRMGFKNMVIQRTHYEVKKVLALEKNLEFLWRQSWDFRNTTDIFCHMMPFYFYDIPHTCGPEPAVCCQFDFWRIPGYSNTLPCPWGIPPEVITSQNVGERARKLLDQYRKKSMLYKSKTLLVPLGDDFRYASIKEAETQFENYQKLFDYINRQPELRAEVKFGTLEDYFSTLRAEASRTSGNMDKVEVPGFASLAGDFFTYADRVDDYWSGYYVTRPFYKAVDRVLEDTLRAANIIFVFTRLQCNHTASCSFMDAFAKSIDSATHNLALFQHHDGVTGTAKDHVVADYALRMHTSLLNLQVPLLASVRILLTKFSRPTDKPLDWFEMEQARSKHNVLPLKKIIKVTDGQMHRVAVFNSLASLVHRVVTILVDSSSVCMFDSKLRSIQSQVSPEWGNKNGTLFTGRHRVQWEAHVPALGFQTYFLVQSQSFGSCKEAVLAKLRLSTGGDLFMCPQPYQCTVQDAEAIEISNMHQTLGFDRDNGLLKWVKSHDDEQITQVEEDILYYSSKGSGAYLFHPTGEARPLVDKGGVAIAAQGPIMQEVHIVPKSILGGKPVTRSARIFGGKVPSVAVEMEYHVELLDHKFNNKEIISRFRTGIDSRRVFYSDLNGFQTIRRETYDKIPLQGNYYPMPSLAFLQGDNGQRFSVHSRQAVGVASLDNGWLEMMLDRRLTGDDDRGLGQGIMDNRPINVVFHLLLERNVSEVPSPSSSAPRLPSLLSHAVGAQLNYPPLMFLGKPEAVKAVKRDAPVGALIPASSLFPLRMDFPCDLHLVGLKALRPTQLPVPEAIEFGLTILRRGWDASYGKNGCKTLDDGSLNLFSIFRDITLGDIRLSTINFVHEEPVQFGYIEQVHRKESIGSAKKNGLIDLEPMEIQAYKFSAVGDR